MDNLINKSLVPIKEKCKRHKSFNGSYMQQVGFIEAKERRKAKQIQCKKCGYWFFKSEY
jgi:hypothetical protein